MLGIVKHPCFTPEFTLNQEVYSLWASTEHRQFQTRASLGIVWVKFWSIVLIAYHYIVLWDDGTEPSDSKDNRPV